MNIRLLFQFLLFFSFLPFSFSQMNKQVFSLGMESQFMIGGELNASFDFLLGGRGKYVFKTNQKKDYFASLGVVTDIANSDSRFFSSDFQLGMLWKSSKKFSFSTSIGSHFTNESHSLLLLDGKQDWQRNYFGFTAQIGPRLLLMDSVSLDLFVRQINFNYTAVGASLFYSF